MHSPTSSPSADQKWHDLLGQLRRQPAPPPRPFFYARVQARLAARRAEPLNWLPGWLRRPVYAALLGTLVLAVSGDGAAPAARHPSQLAHPFAR